MNIKMNENASDATGGKRLRQINIAESFKRARKSPLTFAHLEKSTMDKKTTNGKDIIIDIPLSDESNDDKSATKSFAVDDDANTETMDQCISPVLFSDDNIGSQNSGCSETQTEYIQTPEELSLSLGFPITRLNRNPECSADRPPLAIDDPEHTVFFRPHFRKSEAPRPFPEHYQDKWDNNHVRMPCSPDNLYPVEDQNGVKKLDKRWSIIKRALQRPMKSSLDLEDAIMTYNARYKNKWNFRGLHYFFTEVLSSDAIQYFFAILLPQIVKLALDLPHVCTQPIPLLRRQNSHTLTMSQKQIASLLANAFFCTFPRRNAQRSHSEYATFPDINFNNLFIGTKDGQNPRISEKLKCIFHYFQRIVDKEPSGCVTFERRVLTKFPNWESEHSKFREYHVRSEGMIETDGVGMLQIDFANRYIGGGVLRSGCVQEEIRFVICPELLISKLFTEAMEANECVIITGCEQYSNYTGYSDNFQWADNHEDKTVRDSWNRRCTEIIAMDATYFRVPREQYSPKWLRREINKAYCGFYGNGIAAKHLSAIATGNWGCGAFRGAPHLKSLLQFMAASVVGRDMLYFTFHNTTLCEEMNDMFTFLKERNVTVGEVWKILLKYAKTFPPAGKRPKVGLFVYIRKVLDAYDTNTESDEEASKREIQLQRAERAVETAEDVLERNEDDMLLALYAASCE